VDTAATVIKTTTGGLIWTPVPVATGLALYGDTIYSMTAIGDDQLVVGGNAGYVAYTADGNTTWTLIPSRAFAAAAPAQVTATGFATGDTVFAASGAAINNWLIGVSTPLTGWNTSLFAPAPILGPAPTSCDGIAYVNDALYVLNSGVALFRYTAGTGFGIFNGPSDIVAATGIYVGGTTINALQSYTGSTTLVVRAVNTTDTIQSYTLYLSGDAAAPTQTYPKAGDIIPINGISGTVSSFQFMWNASSTFASAPGTRYGYNVEVYLDEAGTISVWGSPSVVAIAGVATVAVALPSGGFSTTPIGMPGTTYYWRVRVASNSPMQSAWSPMQSFAVQQLQAIVPVLSSPSNGFSVTAGMAPAFSWNPIASATSYKFEVSTDPAFATTIYSTTTASAGAAIPSSVKLVAGTNYFWRVKTLTPAEGDWSAVSNFSVAAVVAPPVVTTQAPPTLTVILPPVTTTSIVIPPATTQTTEVNPSYIWAIIIIGAVLVIAVIVLIVRTRRSV
jgi:hypothetical protein